MKTRREEAARRFSRFSGGGFNTASFEPGLNDAKHHAVAASEKL